jgi:hypothetical protein
MGQAAQKRALKPREANPQVSKDNPRAEAKKQEKYPRRSIMDAII